MEGSGSDKRIRIQEAQNHMDPTTRICPTGQLCISVDRQEELSALLLEYFK